MVKGSHRSSHLWLALALVVVLLSGTASAAQITLLHFNDAYDLPPVDEELGGFDRLATLIDQYRAQHPNALVLFAGDLISPSLASSVFYGSQMIQGMNVIGVDYAAFGNHEWDFGDAVLQERIAESEFTWLSTNVLWRMGLYPGTQTTALVEVDGVKVGLVGLVSRGEETRCVDPIVAARIGAERLKAQGAEVIVALTHLTIAEDRALLAAVPEIDVVLGGHDHDVTTEWVGRQFISKAGSEA